MGKKEEAESIVQIDEHHLDRECIELPTQYLRWAHETAEAKRGVDEAKAYLDVCQAEMAMAIRKNPGKFGMEKVTETSITAMTSIQPTIISANKELQKARHRHEMAQAVVWALEHKKRSLTLLVELHGLGYFSDVKVSSEGKDAVTKMTRRRSVRKKGD